MLKYVSTHAFHLASGMLDSSGAGDPVLPPPLCTAFGGSLAWRAAEQRPAGWSWAKVK